jgi:hypothetical protein
MDRKRGVLVVRFVPPRRDVPPQYMGSKINSADVFIPRRDVPPERLYNVLNVSTIDGQNIMCVEHLYNY